MDASNALESCEEVIAMIDYIPKLAWKPEIVLDSDPKFESIKASLSNDHGTSERVDLRQWCSPVENQGHIGSCAANAAVGGLEYQEIKKGLAFVELSRLFIYFNGRLPTNETDKDNGSYIRDIIESLSKVGTCSEDVWKYDTTKVFERPTWSAYREAYAHKINAFYRINTYADDRHSDVKAALRSGNVVEFGMTVDSDYSNVANDGVVAMPKKTRTNTGGHAQLIVGFDDSSNVYIVRNSWGKNWGCEGYAYVPYEYVDESRWSDIWVLT